jgi:AraC-like DNA-binding protein
MNPDQAAAPMASIIYDGMLSPDYNDWHHHERAQLLYCSQGSFHLEITNKAFLVPPTRAIWIPAKMQHHAYSAQRVSHRSLYFDIHHFKHLATQMEVIKVSPLLKELIIKACSFKPNYPEKSPESRIGMVIVDEILKATTEPFFLPLSKNTKLTSIKHYILDHLANKPTHIQIAEAFHINPKTLSRLCKKETGMTLEQWVMQIKLLKAIEMISTGATTTLTAQSLGYSNDSAFIYMFKKLTGGTPSELYAKQNS